jgi:ribosome biogenesis GTPase
MYDLHTLGFSPFFEAQITNSEVIPARVAAEHRGGYEVWAAGGEGFAQLAGRLARDLEGEEFPGVGDWVTLKSIPCAGQTAVIDGVLQRRTVLIRGAAGRQTRGQVIAANVDVVFVVCGLDADYNVRRIERYLARVWASGAQPVVILNKADVCDEIDVRVDKVKRACLEVPVHVVSALLSDGVDAIRDHLGGGITTAFVGSSGAGKSTLINALLGEERMATGEVRAKDGRGSHTTTHRQLILLPEHGLLIDTPGMRELHLFDEEGIGTVFSDIEKLSEGCRFRDCGHRSEPGCAVRAAVDAGDITAERLEHYLKMETEARSYEVRHDERRRREADRALGKQHAHAAEMVRRWKKRK